jgi:hypothetical protein
VRPDEFRSSYDAVAEVYARTFFDELSRKPFDREVLDGFATLAPQSHSTRCRLRTRSRRTLLEHMGNSEVTAANRHD